MSIVERKNNVLPRITDSILIKLLLEKRDVEAKRESESERESEKENQSTSFIVINCGM